MAKQKISSLQKGKNKFHWIGFKILIEWGD